MNLTNVASQKTAPQRPLLQTKLCMPRLRHKAITRPRLIEQLNTAVAAPDGLIQPKLTLITGPAGYGKTTLASQWLSDLRFGIYDLRSEDSAIENRQSSILNPHFAWLSLDAGDNDEARFLAYLFAAVGTVQEEIGEAAQARLTTTYLYNDTQAILTAFLNDLAVCNETIILVLDDYHLISATAVHEIITFILQHMPVQLHLVITSRSEPPLPLALLRARHSLNEITARDLRFTSDEASQFLDHTMGISLPSAQINQLDEQVEGWVTGLQLIALALQENVTLQQSFSGNQRYLVDYLADQVLGCQSPEVQEFLLKTAVLSQFNADLCTALTDRDSYTILSHVETANLFLIPLDAQRHWYRYHHLFADFLNGRLQQQKSPADIANLHQRAAHWYQNNNQPLTAVDHALAAGDYDLAITAIEQVARQVLMFGEGSTLRHWLESLPSAKRTAQPTLILYYAWSLIRTGDLDQAKAMLKAISDQLDTPLLWGEWSALWARLAVMTGDVDVNIRFSQKALSKLPPDQHMLRSEVAINLGFSHLQQADVIAARAAFAEAAQNTAHDPGLWAVMFATFYWGQTYERQAQLQEAYEIYQRGLALAEGQMNGRSPSSAVGFMHIALGRILYEWNRLAEAESHIRRALACAERSGDHKMLIYSREALAQLLVALGDWPAAQAVVNDLEQQIQAPGTSKLRAILALQCGDIAVAQQWATNLEITLADPPERIREWPMAYLTLAQLHLAQREFERVVVVLETLAAHGAARQSTQFLINVTCLQALAYGKQGDMATAVSHCHQALSLAEPGGYIRLFLDHQDATMARLLHQVAASGSIMADYAHKLLAQLDPHQTPDTPTIQPLSPRELDVLQHLAAGLTNRQIAAQMVISLNTVKAHTRRLYAKLYVNSRTQAVARARQLHLL